MDPPEELRHSFFVDIWIEETTAEAGRASWRGSITHIASRKRRHLKDLDDIAAFIRPYLQSMGVEFGAFFRMKRWLKRRRAHWMV